MKEGGHSVALLHLCRREMSLGSGSDACIRRTQVPIDTSGRGCVVRRTRGTRWGPEAVTSLSPLQTCASRRVRLRSLARWQSTSRTTCTPGFPTWRDMVGMRDGLLGPMPPPHGCDQA